MAEWGRINFVSGGSAKTIRVLFFGATAEGAGRREDILALAGSANIDEAVNLVVERHPALEGLHLITAVNEEYAGRGAILEDGDDLAIFTAVSGG